MGLMFGADGYIGSRLNLTLKFDVHDVGFYSKKNIMSTWASQADHDVIIWLAAYASNWLCEKLPHESFDLNVWAFNEVVNKLRDDQLLIYASSASVYGQNPGVSIEDDPFPTPLLNYDLQKSITDQIAAKHIADGKNIIGLRFGTVNGISPHCRTDLMVNSMVLSAIDTGRIRLQNLYRRRSLLYLEDLVTAFELMLAKPIPGIYNLHSINTTVEHLGHEVAHLMGADIEVLENNPNPYDFAMSSNKFISTFGNFRKTSLVDVVDGLWQGLGYSYKTRRDELPKNH